MRINRQYVSSLLEQVSGEGPADLEKLKAAFAILAGKLLEMDAYAGALESRLQEQASLQLSPTQALAQQMFVYAMSSSLGEFPIDFEAKCRRIRDDALHAAETFFSLSKER
jgi:hypothetical protein